MRFIPALYDNREDSYALARMMAPFDAVLLFDAALGLAPRFRQDYPHAFLIGRRWNDAMASPWLRGMFPSDAGYLLGQVLCMEVPEIDGWQSLNEPPKDLLVELAYFEAGFADACAEAGKVPFIGNFGSGYPEADQLAEFLAHFQQARRHPDAPWVLNIHCYGPAPPATDDLMRNEPGWNALRFKELWYPAIAPPQSGAGFPWVVALEIGPNGYQQDPPGWHRRHTVYTVSYDEQQFMEKATQIKEFLGGASYCIGNSGQPGAPPPAQDWSEFMVVPGQARLQGQWNRQRSPRDWRIILSQRPQTGDSGIIPIGGDAMGYREQQANLFAAWDAAGGVESNFKAFFAGQKAAAGRTLTDEEWQAVLDRLHSAAKEYALGEPHRPN